MSASSKLMTINIFKKQRVKEMPRIARRTTIGIKVSKAPGVKSASGRLKATDGMEPRVIDKNSHKKFVKNVFAIRGRTEEVA